MQPSLWQPPVELSEQEEQIVKKIRKAKLFVFLRQHRHELLDEVFQQELAGLYRASKRGQPPIAPALLALATIVQAYTGVSDDEVIEATLMDRRWQLVLNCLDVDQAPFSKGTLVGFRQQLINAQMDRRLIERSIEVASRSQAFGSRALRAALDSSPLWGAGRVEDTYNLVGHALKKVMRVVADQQGREPVEVASEAGAELVCGTSLKAALDRDWDQQIQKDEALTLVLQVLQTVEIWVQTLTEQEEKAAAQQILEIAEQVQEQDVQIDETRISLIYAATRWSTICTSLPVPKCFRLRLDYLTGALAHSIRVIVPFWALPDKGCDGGRLAALVKGASIVLDGMIVVGHALELAQIVQP